MFRKADAALFHLKLEMIVLCLQVPNEYEANKKQQNSKPYTCLQGNRKVLRSSCAFRVSGILR